ncbi:MAG: universal stress protein, partial [Bacteroidetes bacterium]
MKKILVPTDRSDNAKHALNYGLNLFEGQEVEFILFQSFDVPAYTADMPMPMDAIDTAELERVLEEDVAELRKKYADSGFRFTVKVEVGSLSFNVDELVSELGIDLVLMGTKGASGIAASIIGTNTADVIQMATCTVLAVPEQAQIVKPTKILFATDNKGLSSSDVVEPLIEIAEHFGAHVHLMNVLDEGKMTSVDEAVAGLKLDHMLDRVEHTFHFENSND